MGRQSFPFLRTITIFLTLRPPHICFELIPKQILPVALIRVFVSYSWTALSPRSLKEKDLFRIVPQPQIPQAAREKKRALFILSDSVSLW